MAFYYVRKEKMLTWQLTAIICVQGYHLNEYFILFVLAEVNMIEKGKPRRLRDYFWQLGR